MKINELLLDIENIAKANRLNTPFIVGGVPRDRMLGQKGRISEIADVDITTGDKDAAKLAFAINKKYTDSVLRTYDDGHISLDILGLHIDFSSNFIVPNIDKELKRLGVKDITPMRRELYSRDFTINTLLESLDFTAIYDLTGEAIGDIQSGLIKCPIDPKITIGVDPRRILRAIKFSVKYDFKIEENLKQTMLEYRKSIKNLPTKFIQDKANEIVLIDADKGVDSLIEFKLLPLIPLTKTMSDILIQKRQLVRAL